MTPGDGPPPSAAAMAAQAAARIVVSASVRLMSTSLPTLLLRRDAPGGSTDLDARLRRICGGGPLARARSYSRHAMAGARRRQRGRGGRGPGGGGLGFLGA